MTWLYRLESRGDCALAVIGWLLQLSFHNVAQQGSPKGEVCLTKWRFVTHNKKQRTRVSCMPFLTETELASLNFKSLGLNVRISDRAAIYNPELIEVGDHSRIDDFCVVSGRVSLGRNVHLAVFSNIAGGTEGVCLEDFCGLA